MSHDRIIDILKASLHQELDLLDSLTNEQYSMPCDGPFQSSIGQHIRHNLDHFEAFLDGFDRGKIDYETRGRCELVSTSIIHASEKIRSFLVHLEEMRTAVKTPLLVRQEDGKIGEAIEWVQSSIGRELQFLLGHTVHHHAIICFMLPAHGIPLPEGFGVASSTQRYEEQIHRIDSDLSPQCAR